jgi:solute carrier family 35 (adenosine 3'-phospho 5'-phosphosulfate transporter), member B2
MIPVHMSAQATMCSMLDQAVQNACAHATWTCRRLTKVHAVQLMPAIAFLGRHPDCMWNIIVLSLAATIAQLFISHTIKTFGALLFATVMTTRQFLSILLSCFLFFHPLSWGQMAATVIVFGTLYYKNLSAQKKPAKANGPDGADDRTGPPPEAQSALERLVAAGK